MIYQGMIVWVAGVMMGAGAGLVIGRSLPAVPGTVATPAGMSAAAEGAAVSQGTENLFNPQQLALPFSETTSGMGEIEARNVSAPGEPRRLPAIEAVPVTQNGTVAPGSPATETPAPCTPATVTEAVPQTGKTADQPQLSDFREELKDLAPELSEETLNELERIRSFVEQGLAQPEKKTGGFIFGGVEINR